MMRDGDYEYFISKFGEATTRRDVPTSSIDTWRGRLPDKLLTYWQNEGWCGYQNGLFWTVDPSDYEDLVGEWLEGTPFTRIDKFHVFARSAFGDLYLCGESSGSSVTVNCMFSGIIALNSDLRPKSAADRDVSIQSFLIMSKPSDYDENDADDSPLFSRALAKLGPLAEDEMYGFEPALVAGGTNDIAHLRKVKLDQHLTILRQLAAPSIPFANVDVEKLING